jgi:hypothetical protein
MGTIATAAVVEIKAFSLKQFLVSLGLELSQGGGSKVKVVRQNLFIVPAWTRAS